MVAASAQAQPATCARFGLGGVCGGGATPTGAGTAALAARAAAAASRRAADANRSAALGRVTPVSRRLCRRKAPKPAKYFAPPPVVLLRAPNAPTTAIRAPPRAWPAPGVAPPDTTGWAAPFGRGCHAAKPAAWPGEAGRVASPANPTPPSCAVRLGRVPVVPPAVAIAPKTPR